MPRDCRLEPPAQLEHADAARDWKNPIRLLFIDDSYELARQNWLDWSPFVVNLDYVCLHDIGT